MLPYYHFVSDERVPHVRHLYKYKNIAQFKNDLDFFLSNYQPVGLSDFLAALNEGRALPKFCFLLSFDDGFREMFEIVAPILKAKGIPAVFFINSAFVDNRELCFHQKIALLIEHLTVKASPNLEAELKIFLQAKNENEIIPTLRSIRYANRFILDRAGEMCGLNFDDFLANQKPYVSSEQIRQLLNDGFAIGAHSVDHPFYGDLTLAEQLRQTRESLEFLCEQFGVKNNVFAFPHSDSGVSDEFFERAFNDGTIEVSFGTNGFLRDVRPKHFQRFSMEKSFIQPKASVARQYARRFFRGSIGTRADKSREIAVENFKVTA